LTLSYAFDDWAISNIAKALGEQSIAEEFTHRSKYYKNVWSNGFFCPRTVNNTFDCPNAITALDFFDKRYVEGDAWHYRFFVPGDIEGMIELFGGKEKFIEQLDIFVHRSEFYPLFVLPNPYYWAGNEHDLLSIWLFNSAGRPDKTQMYSRWMLQHVYSTEADGLPGNDDYGTMSAWLIFASIGIYPRAGSSEYFVGSPVFERVSIPRKNNCTLTVVAKNYGEHNIYVHQWSINGRVQSSFMVDHKDLECTGNSNEVVLEFVMSKEPLKSL